MLRLVIPASTGREVLGNYDLAGPELGTALEMAI
jgi:hypothetical protein